MPDHESPDKSGSQPSTTGRQNEIVSRTTQILGLITVLLLILLGALTVKILFTQVDSYQGIIGVVTAKGTPDIALALPFARALDAAVIKTCCIFLSFMLILLGALYTFRAEQTSYRFAAEGGAIKGTLETASPGLVMMTLGVLMVTLAVSKESSIGLDVPSARVLGQGQTENTASKAEQKLSVSSSLAVTPSLPLQARIEQIEAVNTVVALMEANLGLLRSTDADAWKVGRARLESLRAEFIVAIHPRLRGRFVEWAERAAREPGFLDSLSSEDRREFEEAERLLSKNLFRRQR